MKSIVQYGIGKEIDYESLQLYLQLNYIPSPDTIFRNVKKLMPGHFMKVSQQKLETGRWYEIPFESRKAENNSASYEEAQATLRALLEDSVKRRLVSDVPLGS